MYSMYCVQAQKELKGTVGNDLWRTEERGEERGEKRKRRAGAGARMTCMNGKMSRGKDGFAIHFEARTTSVCLT